MKHLLILNERQRDGSYKTLDSALYKARYVFAINEDYFMVLKDRDGLFLEYQGIKNPLEDLAAFKDKIKKYMNTKTPPNTAAIKSLKNQGFSVKITHWRKKSWKDKEEPLVLDKAVRATKNYRIVSHFGGATTLFLKKGDEEITVRADCYAKDRFDKRRGIKAVLDRLEKLHNIVA